MIGEDILPDRLEKLKLLILIRLNSWT
jgi:hypothetical protein